MPNYENVILLLNMAIFDEGICVETTPSARTPYLGVLIVISMNTEIPILPLLKRTDHQISGIQ